MCVCDETQKKQPETKKPRDRLHAPDMIESIQQRALLPDDAHARNVSGNAGSSSGMRIQSHAPHTDRERQREVVKRVQDVCDKAYAQRSFNLVLQ